MVRFVIITGLSGAGKSQAMRFMEDIGFYCIDNMPPALIPKFAEICLQSQGKMEKVALVMDIRGGELFKDLFTGLDTLKESGQEYEILFLESSDEVLIKRYKETRRKHPLALDGRVIEAIKRERELLKDVRQKAHYIIDTSSLLLRQFKEHIVNVFVTEKQYKGMMINIVSFGFKYGIVLDADIVFDVRFIPNPYYISTLKKLSGKNQEIQKYVLKWPETQEFLYKLKDMVTFLIPNYIKEGKSQLVVAIGCTGGKHRSVTVAQELYEELSKQEYSITIEHRDVEKDSKR